MSNYQLVVSGPDSPLTLLIRKPLIINTDNTKTPRLSQKMLHKNCGKEGVPLSSVLELHWPEVSTKISFHSRKKKNDFFIAKIYLLYYYRVIFLTRPGVRACNSAILQSFLGGLPTLSSIFCHFLINLQNSCAYLGANFLNCELSETPPAF